MKVPEKQKKTARPGHPNIVADIVPDIVADIGYDIGYDILPDNIVPVGSCSGNDGHRCQRGSIAPSVVR